MRGVEPVAATGHPWFGDHRLAPAAPAETLRHRLRRVLQDTGWPYQPVLPAAPMTIPRASYAELFRVAGVLVGLLRRTALETAPTVRERLAVYQMPASEDQLWLRDPLLEERYADWVARPDAVIGPDGLRFVEFNVSGALGGAVETQRRLDVWGGLYADADGRLPYHSPDPFAVRAEMFRALSAELGVAPRVAIVGSAQVTGVDSYYFEVEAEYHRSRGLPTRFFEPKELHEAWDCPPELRYPIGLRNFTIPDWKDAGVPTVEVQEALDHGTLLVGTQTATFLHSKLTMGLLSEGRPWMTATERSLVNRYLPWTRVLSERRTERAGEQVDLLPYVLRNRERLVLKEALGDCGKQVVIGPEVDAVEWEAAVAAGADGTSIVQEFVPPQTCRVALLADGADEPHDAEVAPVLGPLLFGGRPAGLWCRYRTDGAAGIVNARGSATGADNAMVAL
ncbi:hypothetical protein [Salinispora pacifica]|uniref:hypothetical protein n=1 Tax=Salinispora pacifica TaxID=351187 RepID=UPI00036CCDA8|nr:hypothetical protein [Salinispora pacifica]